jgi:MFS family permease
MCACTVLVVGFVASINLAVPKLSASSLHPSASAVVWIVDIYVVFFACLVIPGGAVGDRFGRKGTLVSGLLLFAVGAVVSAAAPDVAVMLLGRAVTGLGAAAVLPNSLATIMHTTAPDKRAGSIAVWAAMTGIGGVVGNVGGGAILTAGSWRWLFVAAALLALGCAAWVGRSTPVTSRHERHLDPIAAGLLTFAALGLLVGIIQGPEDGWLSWKVIAGFILSVAFLGGWAAYELRSEHPLLDPRLFRIPLLRGSCLGMFVAFFGLFGLFYVNASFLQYARGYGLIQTGVAILPVTLPLLLGARLVPRLSGRIGMTATVAIAFALIGGGLIGLSTSAKHEPYPAYGAWLVVLGIGITLALPTLTAAISGSLPRSQAGVGAGLQSTMRELGSAVGVAIVGTILTSRFSSTVSHGVGGGARAHETVAQALAHSASPAARHSIANGFAASASTAMLVTGVITLIAGVLVTAQSAWSSRTRGAQTVAAT